MSVPQPQPSVLCEESWGLYEAGTPLPHTILEALWCTVLWDHRAKCGALSPPCWAEQALQRALCQVCIPTICLPSARWAASPRGPGCQECLAVRLWPAAVPVLAASARIRAASPWCSAGLPMGFQRTAGDIVLMNQRLLEGRGKAGLAVEGQPLIFRLPTSGAVNRRWPFHHQENWTSGEQEWSSGGWGDWPDLSPLLTVNVTPSTDSGLCVCVCVVKYI